MTQTTDSFITQAEKALALLDAERPYVSPRTNSKVQDALRSLLGEYKRLTTEQEWEYSIGYQDRAGVWDPDGVEVFEHLADAQCEHEEMSGSWTDGDCIIRRRPAGPWVPVEGEDQ